ncbi:MAG: asparagine synthase (glutamine-hydrolyzing) [Planctomycetaceae bacterium]|nr:asparagine synthase (glutamine-hydrolyzing) [Planctomycetaceae bacterium]MCB9953156.1 asparagine synthase (glutamine-hydrolyzing) [Planctomycetaceae bacterium]
MCGIAGAVWSRPDKAITASVLRRMTDVIVHRGPDDAGEYFSPESSRGVRCALGFRRLSIIDLSGGHQPLSNEDGTIWVTLNGEVYNYRELREDLLAKGHKFATSSDTEVIVHLYEEHGADCIKHLRGMFAIVLWDATNQRLLLARDRLGQKPLVYRQEEGRLLYASELKSILQVPAVPREVDPRAVEQFLTYQYVPHPHCILKGYAKLQPAHLAIYEGNELTVHRYWSPEYEAVSDTASPLSTEQWSRELRETLTESVRLRMRSDVPIGSFLSGGIDSTIISGLMQSLSPHPIHTFSIGFSIPEFDERRYAREAAELLGTNHHEYVVEPSVLDTLPRLIWHYDEPFGDSSAIPTMYLSEVTRQLVTVALSGDGGDELFAGYPRYRAVHLAGQMDRLPAFMRNMFGWKLWQQIIPSSQSQRSFGRRLKRFLSAISASPELRYLRWIGIFDHEARHDLYTPEFQQSLDGYDSSDIILDAYKACPNRDFVTRTTCADVHTYLPCDILTKVDIASMAFSLEARSPFLDHQVVELAARMPIELKFSVTAQKRILIETFSDLLPASIKTRPKMGFGVPIDHWFRNELRSLLDETLLTDRFLSRGYFRPETIQRLVNEHQSGKWDHRYRLWNLIVFEHWHRMFIDGDVPTSAPMIPGYQT